MICHDRTYNGLLDAAYALDERAAGRVPESGRLLVGAITLDLLFRRGKLDGDLQDAAIVLEQLVTEGPLSREPTIRPRVAELAHKVRLFAGSLLAETNAFQALPFRVGGGGPDTVGVSDNS